MPISKDEFFKQQEQESINPSCMFEQFCDSGKPTPNWQAVAEQRWAAMEAAAAWFDQPLPDRTIFVWTPTTVPKVFTDKHLHRGFLFLHSSFLMAAPPGIPHFHLEGLELPNGWRLAFNIRFLKEHG